MAIQSQIGSSAELKALSVISKQIDNFQKKLCCDAAVPPGPVPGASCGLPLFVEVCNQTPGIDQELVFTDAVPICVDNGDDTFSTWFTRESIVWDSVAAVIISRVTEFSNDGATWTVPAPATFTLGLCPIPDLTKLPSISEGFGDDLSTLLEGNNFSITKPACCKIKITTSIGSFHMMKGVQFYNTSDFLIPITISNVEIVDGDCALDAIHIISNKLS
jgi:hypothetical protein